MHIVFYLKDMEIEHNIIFSKGETLKAVGIESAYLGAKREAEGNGAYEKIRAIEADNELLERYWLEGWSTLTLSLRHYLTGIRHDSNTCTFTLHLSSLTDRAQLEGLEAEAQNYMSCFVLAQWYKNISTEAAAEKEKEALAHLSTIRNKLCSKTLPQRPQK